MTKKKIIIFYIVYTLLLLTIVGCMCASHINHQPIDDITATESSNTTLKIVETIETIETTESPETTIIEVTETTETETTEIETTEIEDSTTVEIETDKEVDTEGAIQPISLGEFKLTAYCSCKKCCGKWALNRPIDENGKEIVYGAIGERLTANYSIAVDPTVIPYRSEVIINGHTYKAQDCGGAIKGNRIDVYFENHEDAWDFGVQYAEVFIIPK